MFRMLKKKRFPWGKMLFAGGLVGGIATISIITYKYIEGKYRSIVLGMIDLDDDCKSDTVMLDKSANGEVNTITMDLDID